MCALCGRGTYEAVNVMPRLTAAPPKSFARLEGEYEFWMTNCWLLFDQLVPVSFAVALALNWKDNVWKDSVRGPTRETCRP